MFNLNLPRYVTFEPEKVVLLHEAISRLHTAEQDGSETILKSLNI